MALHEKAREVAPRVRYEWDMLHWTATELGRIDEENVEEVEHDGQWFEKPLLAIEDSELELQTVDNIDGSFGCLIASEGGSSGKGDPRWNALLESMLIHARVLYHFFTRDRKYPDDVIAPDFFDDDHEWTQFEETELRKSAVKRMDKALAHLTYQRIEFEKHKTWQISVLYKDLMEMWKRFWQTLPPARQEWFRSDVDGDAG